MPVDPDQLITITRPMPNLVDSSGVALPMPVDLRTVVPRRTILGVRVTVQVGAPPAGSPPGTANRLNALVLVMDVVNREVDIAILDKFDGKRLDHFYDHMTHLAAILSGSIADTDIVFMTTNDFPAN